MPHREIAALKRIIVDTAQSIPGGTPCLLKLKEMDPASALKSVIITYIDSAAIAIHPDKGQGSKRCFSHLLKKGKGLDHNQSCDHILLVQHEGCNYVIFIEMKSNNPRGCSKQFLSTLCFWHYLQGVLSEIMEIPPVGRKRVFIVLNTKRDSETTLVKRATAWWNFPDAPGSSAKQPRYKIVSDGERIPVADLL